MLFLRDSRPATWPRVMKYVVIVCGLSASALAVNYINNLESTPFGIRQKTDIWSTSTKEVTFSLVLRSIPLTTLKLQRAYIYSALTAKLDAFASDVNTGEFLGNVYLAIIYPDMTPYAVYKREREDPAYKVPIEDQLIVAIAASDFSSESKWRSRTECCIRHGAEEVGQRKGLFREGNFLNFERYNRYVLGDREPFQTLLRPTEHSYFSFVECMGDKIGLCTTYLDLDGNTQLEVHSVNVLRTKDLQLHERQIRAVIAFLNGKKVS
jgi:hypothetical protein